MNNFSQWHSFLLEVYPETDMQSRESESEF